MSDTAPSPTIRATPEAASRQRLKLYISMTVGALVITAVVVVILLVTGGSSDTRHNIVGTVILNESAGRFRLSHCEGSGGDGDLTSSAPVSVRDGQGRLLATSRLGPGKTSSHSECTFTCVVRNVADATTYAIKVSHRAVISRSRGDLQLSEWTVTMAVGH